MLRKSLFAAAFLVAAAGPIMSGSASAQMRNIGPGVADRTGAFTRAEGDEIIFGGEIQASLALDRNGRRGGRAAYPDAFSESLASGYLLLPYGFSINGVARLEEAARDPDGTNRIFRDHALWLDEFYATWTQDVFDVFGGKIHPRFGSAWDRGPGLYGTDFGREYEQTEKLGGGLRVWLSDLVGLSRSIGTHNAQVEVFEADRSLLSTSLGAKRWQETVNGTDPATGEATTSTLFHRRNRTATGGPDNTGYPGGTVLSLAGYGIPMPRGQAGYTASLARRSPGNDAINAMRSRDEYSGTFGAFWTFPLPFRIVGAPFAEYARQENAGGFRDRSSAWTTAGFDLRRTPFTLSFAHMSNRASDDVEATRTLRVQNTASLSYDLYFIAPLPILRSASATMGWRRLAEGGNASNDFGAQVAWSWKF